MDFFSSRKTGDIVTRFQDAGVIKDIFTNVALTSIIDVSMVSIIGVVLYTVNVKLFLITIIMALLSAVLIYAFKRSYRKLNRKSMEQGARLNSQVIEGLNAIEAVKTNSCEDHVMDRIETEYIKALRIAFKGGVLSNVQGSLSSTIGSIGNLAILVIGGYAVMGGETTLGTLIAFMSLAGYFIDPIGRLVNLQLSIQEADISMKRLAEIYSVDEEEEIEDGKTSSAIDDGIKDIKIDNVSFGYGSRPLTLKNVDMEIHKGEKVGIVGRSGCGKTTLSKIFMKFYIPKEGRILYNGSDMEDIDAFALRKKIGCVPQNVQLLSGTIRENLLMGRSGISQSEIDAICDSTGCSEFIRKLPAGYDTFLDENGGGLSGGEKQRLSIARALIGHPDLVVMDESTSNMDFITERTVHDMIFDSNATVVMIAHRLSTIRRCDTIYVMDSGTVCEHGTHEELMRSNGKYAQMWHSQVGDDVDTVSKTNDDRQEDREIEEEGDDVIEYS